MSHVLRQAWWAPVAALLVVGQVVIAAIFIGDENAAAGITIGLGGALLVGVGLWKRPDARVLGDVLLVAGSLVALIWFWTVVVPLLALLVLVGLAVTEVRANRLAG